VAVAAQQTQKPISAVAKPVMTQVVKTQGDLATCSQALS
jgi:hypothetical protein